MKRKVFVLLLAVAIICFSFAGCGLFDSISGEKKQEAPTERTITFVEPTYTTFSVDGIELKLPDNFQKIEMEDGLPYFYDGNYAVFLTREAFTTFPFLQDMTLGEYGQSILSASGIDAAIEVIDGLYCFEYEDYSIDHTTKHNYFVVLFKSNQACWIVQFAAPFWNADPMRSKFISWAKTITFTD